MKKPSYTNIILTIIAILLALLVLEQRYELQEGLVLNRLTGNISVWHKRPNIQRQASTIADTSEADFSVFFKSDSLDP